MPALEIDDEYRWFSAAYVETELQNDKGTLLSFISGGDFTYDLIELVDRGNSFQVDIEDVLAVIGLVGSKEHQQVEFSCKRGKATTYLSWWAVQERDYELVPNFMEFFSQGIIFNNKVYHTLNKEAKIISERMHDWGYYCVNIMAHNHGAVLVVDITSTLAMLPIDIETENIDFCMVSAQKSIQAMAEIHKGLQELGLREVIPLEIQSGLVAAVAYPDNPQWDFKRVHDYCYERGFTIYPGKMQNQGTFGLCVLGAITADDIKAFFAVFQQALRA